MNFEEEADGNKHRKEVLWIRLKFILKGLSKIGDFFLFDP